MPTTYLLDTTTVSDILKARSSQATTAFKAAQAQSPVLMSVLTRAELMFGFAKRPQATSLRSAFVDFSRIVEVMAWDEAATDAYATLRLALLHRERTLATMDLLIAAHALSLGATLVTSDKAFQSLEGLVTLMNWSADLRQSNR